MHQQGLSAVLLCPTVDVPHAWAPPDFGRPIRRAGRLTRSTLHPAFPRTFRPCTRVFLNTMWCLLRTGKRVPRLSSVLRARCGSCSALRILALLRVILGLPCCETHYAFPRARTLRLHPRAQEARGVGRAVLAGSGSPRAARAWAARAPCSQGGAGSVLTACPLRATNATALSSRRLRPGRTCVGAGLVFARL